MQVDRATSKRQRSDSPSSSASAVAPSRSQSPSLSPPPKYHRASHSPSLTSGDHLCTLAPTCSQPGTASSYATEADLLRHQDAFHRWVCRTPVTDQSPAPQANEVPSSFVSSVRGGRGKRVKECGKAFPDERLLGLHHIEVHDPLARTRKEKGENIFECFLPKSLCKKVCANPAKRRRHLIDKHYYPKDYFFSITRFGINDLASKEGLGFSLIRPSRPSHCAAVARDRHDDSAPAAPSESRDAAKQDDATNNDPVVETVARGLLPEGKDFAMDDLTLKMKGLESSLHLKPRTLRKKGQIGKEGNGGQSLP